MVVIKTKTLSLLIMLVTALLVAAQCGTQPTETTAQHFQETESGLMELTPVALKAGQKLKVVATTTIIGDLARNVGGDLIELNVMLPIGSDPHTFTPTPQDAALVANAHVIFINGLHLEEFLDELIQNAGGNASIITVSNGIDLLNPAKSGQEEAGHERKEETGGHQYDDGQCRHNGRQHRAGFEPA